MAAVDGAALAADGPADHNQVVVVGRLSRDPEVRELPSGDRLVLLRIVVRRPDGTRTDSLPVAVGPPPRRGQRRRRGQADARTVRRAAALRADERVRVEGYLERRFWRDAGAGRTRLQIVAEQVSRRRAA